MSWKFWLFLDVVFMTSVAMNIPTQVNTYMHLGVTIVSFRCACIHL